MRLLAPLLAPLLALLVPAFAFAADEKKDDKPPALAGKYECKGGGYGGTVKISEDGAGYKVEWDLGKETYSGVGIWEGDRLCVAWANENVNGIIVYKRDKDGTLKGKWTIPGGARLEEETLTPEKKK